MINHIKHLVARVPGVVHRYDQAELARLIRVARLTPVEIRTYPRTYTILGRRQPANGP